MRPRKKIVLLMSTMVSQSLWQLRLETWMYAALTASTLEEALAHLDANPGCDVVVTDITCSVTIRQIQRGTASVLCIEAHPSLRATTEALAFEPRGPELPARVRDRLRILLVRKRGPKKMPVASVTIPTAEPIKEAA